MNRSVGNVGTELGASASGQDDNANVFNRVPSAENSIVIKTEQSHDLTSISTNDFQNETDVEMMADPVATIPPAVEENGDTGRERLIRSHSSARFSFELSGNSN